MAHTRPGVFKGQVRGVSHQGQEKTLHLKAGYIDADFLHPNTLFPCSQTADHTFGNFIRHGPQTETQPQGLRLDTPRIINLRSRQNPPASGLCLPKLQRDYNSSVWKILQTISFVSNILQTAWPVSGLLGRVGRNRYPGGMHHAGAISMPQWRPNFPLPPNR